ncbi:hypothetical protein BCR33DRAFT_350381 [Rhizoclosmatium globosum]|uniref:C2H2-type domain-containing protein n=1 Tax=Rhizoclosmatium globosum TaxID=329046 RepID=A0A1Y2C1U0_9FUNG|nr:hypothetical protein BCR33DRAFT_350381 [Rhizoclosmatium globosum]|eukprot:ORY40971.1 hypothetical protein BCR33DRAFT_350381 [Rhizoclosmatium globosum]
MHLSRNVSLDQVAAASNIYRDDSDTVSPDEQASVDSDYYECFDCNGKFQSYDVLQAHFATCNSSSLFSFSSTSSEMNGPSSLEESPELSPASTVRSTKSHQQQHSFDCKLCPDKFRYASHLERHLTIHKGGSRFCDLCGSPFRTARALTGHKKQHH